MLNHTCSGVETANFSQCSEYLLSVSFHYHHHQKGLQDIPTHPSSSHTQIQMQLVCMAHHMPVVCAVPIPMNGTVPTTVTSLHLQKEEIQPIWLGGCLPSQLPTTSLVGKATYLLRRYMYTRYASPNVPVSHASKLAALLVHAGHHCFLSSIILMMTPISHVVSFSLWLLYVVKGWERSG